MKNETEKTLIITIHVCALLLVISFGIYKWITKDIINVDTLWVISIIFGNMIHYITWGTNFCMGSKLNEKPHDERQEYIIRYSSKISYFILIVAIFIVILVTEFPVNNLNEIKNIPLFIVLCLSIIVLPTVEYIVSKKYR